MIEIGVERGLGEFCGSEAAKSSHRHLIAVPAFDAAPMDPIEAENGREKKGADEEWVLVNAGGVDRRMDFAGFRHLQLRGRKN